MLPVEDWVMISLKNYLPHILVTDVCIGVQSPTQEEEEGGVLSLGEGNTR
jgi:hypothetical protein